MALARAEPADGSWASRQVLAARLRALGYSVELLGAGGDWVLLLS